MEIRVNVKPKSGRSKVIETNSSLLIYTVSDSRNGRANDEVISLVAKHYDVSEENIKITSGRNKPNKKIKVQI